MSARVSKSQIETQGRGEHVVAKGERKLPQERSESRIDTETYQAILARELLFNDSLEEYCKFF